MAHLRSTRKPPSRQAACTALPATSKQRAQAKAASDPQSSDKLCD